MKAKRILSLILAFLMTVSPFLEILPVFASATETSSETISETSTKADSEEKIVASYDIPASQITFSEDGGLHIDLPESLESLIDDSEDTDASEPSHAGDPTETTGASEATEAPAETTEVTEPDASAEETGSTETTEPSEPADAAETTEATEPDASAEETGSTETTETTEPSEPAETTEATEPDISAEDTELPEESVPAEPVFVSWYDYLSAAAGDHVSKENCAGIRKAYLSFAADNQFAADSLTLTGQMLTATVSSTGHFALEGLLYDAQEPWSTETRITIDGSTVIPFEADTVTASGDAITAVMSVAEPALEIAQIISFVPGTDMLNVCYTIRNRSAETHTVQVAVLLDTALNENDGPLFCVADEEICTGTALTGEEVPAEVSVLNADGIPAASLMLRGEGLSVPAAVGFCNWQDLYTRSGAEIPDTLLTDSAVCLEYANITAEAESTAQVAFCYGPYIADGEETASEQEENTEEVPAVLSWFQWVEEKGIDVSALSKSEYNALRNEFAAYRLNIIYGETELPEGLGTYGKISNSNIEVAVSPSGNFTIGNKEGNPDYTSDNNQILLFGHPNPSTSETLIAIGDYYDFFTADTTTFSSDTATSTMTISQYNIKVTQMLKLVKSGNANFADQVRIQYTVKNIGKTTRNVGIRIMMDTMLADNDHAPFRVSGTGAITACKTFTGTSKVPNMYQVYDDLDNPTTLSTGYLYMGEDRKPDKVQFCSWPGIVNSSWGHAPADGSELGDSAVGIYFNPKSVAKDGSFSVRTYYGVSVSTNSNNNVISNTDGRVLVRIADSSTNAALADATVTYVMNGQTYSAKTDINGYVLLESWYSFNLGLASPVEPMPVILNISKEGYSSISVRCNMDRNTCYNYKIAQTKAARPSINTVRLIDSTTETDLLQKSVYFYEDSEGLAAAKGNTSTITIQATSNMSGCTYVFCENGGEVASNTTGKFTFKVYKDGDKRYIEKLKTNADHTIICIKNNMHSEAQRFNLKIAGQAYDLDLFPLDLDDFIPGASKSLGKGTVAALLLGDSIKFGPKDADFGFKLEVTDSGYVRLGLNVDGASWNSLKGTSAEKQQEQLEDAMKAWLSDGFSKKSGKDLRKFFKKNQKFVLGKTEAEFVVGGYGEGKLNNGKLELAGFQIHMAVKGGSTNTHYYVVWGCPAYISIGGEVSAKTSITGKVVSGDPQVFKMSGEAMFNLTATLTLQGGFGVKGCASIGAEGSTSWINDFNLVAKSILSKLKGQVKLFVEIFLFKKDLPLLKEELEVYNSQNPRGVSDGGMVTDLIDEVPFRLITREEAYAESAQGGTSTGIGEVRFLSVGSTQYKFFLEDRGGNLSNRNRLAYSVLTDGTWSDAVPVWDDGTTDLYYDIATDGTNIHVVWSNSNKLFSDDSVTVDEMGAAQEICYAVISPDGTISTPLAITSNDALDVMPAVSLANGTAYIAWYHTENGIEYNTDIADHYLNYTSVTDGVLGSVTSISCSNASINTVSATTINGVPVVSYITNASTDIDFRDNVHHELTLSTGSVTTVEPADKELGKPVACTIGGEEKIFWMEDGNIAYADSMSAETPSYVFDPEHVPAGISMNNYTVISVSGNTYLIWTQVNEDGDAVAMTSIYADNGWSAVHPLTVLGQGNVTKLDGYLNSDGNLVLAYTIKYSADVSDSSEIVTATLEKVVIPEQTLEVSGIMYDQAVAAPGQVLPLSFDVRNSGNTAIESIDITITSETGEIYTATQAIRLEPGCDTTVEIADFTLSDDLSTRPADDAYTYTASICVTGSQLTQERTFELGCDDIRVSMRDTAYLDNRKNVVLDIENNSGFPASNVHVRVLADSEDGVMVFNDTIGDLAAHDQKTLYLDIDQLNSNLLYVFTSTACTPSQDSTEIVLSTPITSGTLTVTARGGGSVTPDVPSQFDTGDVVTITAAAQDGYSFAGWTSYRDLVFVSGDASSAHAEIVMPEGNTTVTAIFLSDTAYDFVLSEESAAIVAGEQLQLNAEFASAMESSRVCWSSSDDSVATVSENGLVTGLSAGTATITAASGEYVHTCTVTVSYVDVDAVTFVTTEYYLASGETASVKAVTEPENGVDSLIWTSSDSTVAEVDAFGNILALTPGTATITAVSRSNNQISAQCAVHVVVPVRSILLDQQELYLDLYDNTTAELEISLEPLDATYGKNVIWTVEDEGIVSITPSGEFNEKLTVNVIGHGATVIRAETENGCTADCSVYVEDILHVSSVEELQSDHPYEPGLNRTWVYTDNTKKFLMVSFSEETKLGEHDFINILDGEGNQIRQLGEYDQGSFTVLVPGSTVQIQLSTAADSEGAYGFRVTQITDTLDPDLLQISVDDEIYTGKPIIPYYSVYYGDMYLEKGYDYGITFSNNKAVGLATATITCIGHLEGLQKTETFVIRPSNTELTGTTVKDSIKLSWTASKGAGGYRLFRSVNGGNYELYKTLKSSAKSFTDKDVDNNSAYSYYLEPYKTVQKTDYCANISDFGPITYLKPVSNLTGSATTENEYGTVQVSLSWDPVEGADGYNIYRKSVGGSRFYICGTVYGAETTKWSTDLYEEPNKYQFAVAPMKYVNGMTADGGRSEIITFFNITAPYLNLYDYTSYISVEYDFTDYEEKQGIQIYRSVNGSDFKPYKTITVKEDRCYGEFKDTGAKKSGDTYSYKARVFVKAGGKTVYGPFCEPVTRMYLAAPALKSVKQNEVGSLDLTFTTVSGATDYQIYRSYSKYGELDAPLNALTTVEASDPQEKTITFRDDTVQNAGYYHYAVRAVNANYRSGYSKLSSGMATSEPQLYDVRNMVKGIEVRWESGSMGDKIEIWRSIDGGAYKKLKTLNAYSTNSYTDTSATKSGSTYSYRIRSVSKLGSSSFYSAFTPERSLVKLNSPKISSVKNLTDGGFSITFARVPEADYYTVNTFCDNEFFADERIPGFSEKKHTFEAPKATEEDVRYTFYVTAHRDDGSFATSEVNAYHFGSMMLNAENTSSGIRVTGSQAYASHFTVYRSIDGGAWKKMKKVAANNLGELDWTDTRVSAGKKYEYQVLPGSLFDAETAQYSDTAACQRIACPKITELANKSNGISLNWAPNPAVSVRCYEIWRGTAMYFNPYANFSLTKIGELTADCTSYLDTGIGDDPVSAVYVVKAILDDGTVLSTDQTFIFRMASPTNLQVYFATEKAAQISWQYNGYFTGSQIRYTTNGKTKTVTINGGMTYYYLQGLTPGNIYSVSVRAMMRIDGKTYYSDWSAPRTFAQ